MMNSKTEKTKNRKKHKKNNNKTRDTMEKKTQKKNNNRK